MSRGSCKFKTMDMSSPSGNMEEKGFDWQNTRDPFADAPDDESGVLVPWYTPGKPGVKKRVSYTDRFRKPNDVYFSRMESEGSGSSEADSDISYVSPEQAFGSEPIIEDYSKSIDSGDILNKAFEDDE